MNQKINLFQIHIVVHGRVQGVGFRYFVTESANRLDLVGWVRNRFDGTVEVVAEGTRPQLNNLLQDLQRGSRSSNVTQIDQNWMPATGNFDRFVVRTSG